MEGEKSGMSISYREKIVTMASILLLMVASGCSKKQISKVNHQNDENQKQESQVNVSKKEKANLESLAANQVFNVDWFTKEGEFQAGTAFLIHSKVHNQKILITAFHYLWPEDVNTFEGSELPNFVEGGELYNIKTDETTDAFIKNDLIIEDADIVPNVNKDVAAFTIQNGEWIPTFEVASELPKAGEKVYLLADLYYTEDVHSNCIYEGSVISSDQGVLCYNLDEKYGTNGASGAPIVNEYGEVVGIHIASNGSTRFAHSMDSFMEQIDAAKISEVTYPSDLRALKEQNSEIPAKQGENSSQNKISLSREDEMNTMFFDLHVNQVTVTDELNGISATDGNQYVVINASLKTKEENTPLITMYSNEFYLRFGTKEDEFQYALESGYTTNQFLDSFEVESKKETTGDLVYLVPNNVETVTLNFMDFYTESDSDEVHYGDIYEMTIPMENWWNQ